MRIDFIKIYTKIINKENYLVTLIQYIIKYMRLYQNLIQSKLSLNYHFILK